MKRITICIEFKGGKGYCYVNIIPSDYGIYKQSFSGCHIFFLKPGDYTIYLDGVSPAGGTTVTVLMDDEEIGRARVTKAGPFSKYIDITI